MAITIDDVLNANTPADFLAKLLAAAQTLGITTTTWQEGDPTLTIYETVAQMLGVGTGVAASSTGPTAGMLSLVAKGGFLDDAADPAVTPDPSVPNSDGTYHAGGWLDLLAESMFENPRNGATRGENTVGLTNASATTYGPFLPGTYHVSKTSGGTSTMYSNLASLTIVPGANPVATFVADVAGSASNAAPGEITGTVTSLAGVTVTSNGTFVGANAESNAGLVDRCRAKWTTLAPRTGPFAAYAYYAKTVSEPGYPTSISSPVTRTNSSADKVTGAISIYIANSSGAPAGGDAAIMQSYLQDVCASDSQTLTVYSATNANVTGTVDVYVPAAYAGVVTAALRAAVIAYLATLPVGGVSDEDATTGVPFGAVVDAIARAVPYLRTQKWAMFGGHTPPASLALTAEQVAIYTGTDIAVTFHSP